MLWNMIYQYNDMSYGIVRSYGIYIKNSALGFYNSNIGWHEYTDYLNRFILQNLAKFLHPVLINNMIIIIFTLISIYLTHLLLSIVNRKKGITQFIFSALFSLSLFFFFRIISYTSNTYTIFFIPLVVLLLLKKAKPILVGVLVFIILSFTNYYGFFSFFLVCFWYLFDLISKKINFKEFIKKIFLFLLPVVIGITIFFFPLLKSNLTFSNEYTRENSEKNSTERTVIYRPIEDWYNLSFRPWYFFIPPKSSVFFGRIFKKHS